jgi:hypothetical protein
MIDMTDVATAWEFAQTIPVTRQAGAFGRGGFIVTATSTLSVYGILQPASDEDLEQVEEGDRVTGMMSFISTVQLYKTYVDGSGPESGDGLSDTFYWRGQVYKVVITTPWGDFGFWKAIASRQRGA